MRGEDDSSAIAATIAELNFFHPVLVSEREAHETCTEASESRAQTCNCSDSVAPVPSQAPELQYHSRGLLPAGLLFRALLGDVPGRWGHTTNASLFDIRPGLYVSDSLPPGLGDIKSVDITLPVDLKLETSKRTAEVSTRVDDVKDEQPPRKRLKVDATSEKLLKDGFYIHPLMTMDVETRGDGRQRVLLTSVTDELDSVSLAEAWLAPAEEYPTTGCLELRGALPTARICPHGDNE
ncbi:hypothetical protein FOZ62_027171, partial [Perkinsus olseni]